MKFLTKGLLILTLIFFSANSYAKEIYTCPMHPQYVSDREGSCPICGMDLVAVENNTEEATDEHAMHEHHQMKSEKSKHETHRTVKINHDTMQKIGVVTEEVKRIEFGRTIRGVGIISNDERRQYEVSSRVAGWIEKLYISTVGDEVKKGDILYTLYSPELISAQKDYINSLNRGVQSSVNSTKKRLVLIGVQNKTIDKLTKSKKVFDNVPFYAEKEGIISMLHMNEGTYIKSGMKLAEIQDYSTVWVNTETAEYDLKYLKVGDMVHIIVPSLSNKMIMSKIDYIHPILDKKTKTAKIRVVLKNPNNALKVDSFVDVEFMGTSEKVIAIPSKAILRSSTGEYVIVHRNSEIFEHRPVKTGIESKGMIEITKGLEEGEMVVTSSQFLIDSESSLQMVIKNNSGGGAHAGH